MIIRFLFLKTETPPPPITNRATQAYFNPGTIPTTVPTFHSISIYWRPAEGALANACSVEFREKGSETWHWAQDLWFDNSTHSRHSLVGSYRGSIVNLQPGTTYEIRLTLDSGRVFLLYESTWDEDFKVSQTVNVPAGDTTFWTTKGGSASEGFVVFDGGGAVIDVNGSGQIIRGPPDRDANTNQVLNPASGDLHNIIIDHSYVILRNFTLKGATLASIIVSHGVSNVVIENMDISNWGEIRTDRVFGNARGAIELTENNSQIVIQRNRIHSPRHSANSWVQSRLIGGGPGEHPYGPNGIVLNGVIRRDPSTGFLVENGIWNVVVRYNEIYGNIPNRFFEDGIQGAPPDSDIYRNIIKNVHDNAIELENHGARNVRAWENYIYDIYNAIATTPVYLGPLYVWRNVSDGFDNRGHIGRARPFKVGGSSYSGTWWERDSARGLHFFYHNVNLRPDADDGFQATDGQPHFMIARNNIVLAQDRSVRVNNHRLIEFSHNLFNAHSDAQNSGGMTGLPIWAAGSGPDAGRLSGWYQLAPASPGFGAAMRLANFNDMFDSPDIGAHQSGTARLVFGREAVFIPPPLPAVQGVRPPRLPLFELDPPPPPPQTGHYDTVPFTSSLISNLVVTDTNPNHEVWFTSPPVPNNLVWSVRPNIDAGRITYGDRTFTIREVSDVLRGSDWIRTPNQRTTQTTNANLARFTALVNIYVYIAYDSRAELSGTMGWLASWEETGLVLHNGERTVSGSSPQGGLFFIRRRAFNAGQQVQLGGNHQTGRSMYIPIIRAR